MNHTPKEYPTWICHACGVKYGRGPTPRGATYHEDTCGICGDEAACTEPRDYGGLRDGWRLPRQPPA